MCGVKLHTTGGELVTEVLDLSVHQHIICLLESTQLLGQHGHMVMVMPHGHASVTLCKRITHLLRSKFVLGVCEDILRHMVNETALADRFFSYCCCQIFIL